MRLKRVIGVLLSLPLLHLNVARTAIACERPEGEMPASVATSHGADAPHTLHDHHSVNAGQRTDHPTDGQDLPPGRHTTSTCCQAIGSCSFAFDGAAGETFETTYASCEGGCAPAVDMPTSLVRGPEPPPPRE